MFFFQFLGVRIDFVFVLTIANVIKYCSPSIFRTIIICCYFYGVISLFKPIVSLNMLSRLFGCIVALVFLEEFFLFAYNLHRSLVMSLSIYLAA